MFTQCPNCKTTFQVTAEQLKAANGDVRCGQCLTIFSALDNLSEIEPNNINEDLVSDTESPVAGNASSSIDKNLEEFFGDLFEDSPNKTFDEPLTYASPESPTTDTTKPNEGFFYGANEATIEKILKVEETPPLKIEDDVTDKENSGEDEPIPADSQDTETIESLLDLIEKTDVTEKIDVSNDTGANAADINATDSTESYAKPDEKIDTSNIPDVILDELQAAKAQQLKPPSTQWVVGSVALMLVFVLQAVYFSRDSLAKNPTYRPLLNSACDILGCEINIEFDTRLIEIIGRDVRSHPASKKALIAGTTLINNASYVQPYPLLTLTFSDITSTKLAQRRFTPREYLRSGTDIEAGMPSEIPVQVELHLVDPGKAAVNFEFRTEVDPRS